MFSDVWDEAENWIRPFDLPPTWRLTRAFDWGSSKPFSIGWWAETDGTQPVDSKGERVLDYTIPARSKIRIAEWYGCGDKPNTGLRLPAADIARGIIERERKLGIAGRVQPGAADASIWDKDRGRSIARQMADVKELPEYPNGVRFVKADKGPGTRVSGWAVVRDMLSAAHRRPIEDPCLLVFDRCLAFRRIIAEVPRDETNWDDLDTNSEDHLPDEVRYELTRPRKGGSRIQVTGA